MSVCTSTPIWRLNSVLLVSGYIHDKLHFVQHYDIRVSASVLNDVLNILSMIWLQEVDATNSKFLNIDSLRPDRPTFDDTLAGFHSYYQSIFRFQDILKASTFGRDILCVKRLIMQPKPAIKFHRSSIPGSSTNTCHAPYSSSLLHLFNRHVLKNINESSSSSSITTEVTVAVLYRPLSDESIESAINREMANVQSSRLDPVAHYFNEIIDKIGKIARVRTVNLNDLDFLEQTKIVAGADLMISSSSSGGVTHLLHMPYRNEKCCGVIEVLNKRSKHASGLLGHAHLAQTMGAIYAQIKWSGGPAAVNGGVNMIGNTNDDTVDKVVDAVKRYKIRRLSGYDGVGNEKLSSGLGSRTALSLKDCQHSL